VEKVNSFMLIADTPPTHPLEDTSGL